MEGRPIRLTRRQSEVFERLMAGDNPTEITRATGASYGTIKKVMENPAVRQYMEEREEFRLTELKGLGDKVLNVVKDGLEHPHIGWRLKSVDTWKRLMPEDKQRSGVTAEELVGAVVAQIKALRESQESGVALTGSRPRTILIQNCE